MVFLPVGARLSAGYNDAVGHLSIGWMGPITSHSLYPSIHVSGKLAVFLDGRRVNTRLSRENGTGLDNLRWHSAL